MNDEFTLRWKNFQDNIASGFQNLYDRGDLVDVTLACDGKLLHAHKIVLAICSPYFQEIFITNPCKHPIIILKDVNFTIMCELLEFMYQGTVNVKHTELQAFMKIGQLLQIKGLAANSSSSLASTDSDKSCRHNPHQTEAEENQEETLISVKSSTESNEGKSGDNSNKLLSAHDRSVSPSVASPSPIGSSINIQSNKTSNESAAHHSGLSTNITGIVKRPFDYNSDTLSIYARNKRRRSITSTDQSSENNDTVHDGGAEHITEDFFFPHISMVESRYDLHNIKREAAEHHQSSTSAAAVAANASLRNSFPPPNFSLDYNYYKSGASNANNHNQSTSANQEQYPNDLNMPNDFSKNFANHMDVPPSGTNMIMLSSTSLLHGNCVFNRNNTVATQQGMKTYWLCKSYRISMCRARCITHQGRIISATGVHNHAPHMRSGNNITSQGASGGNGNGNGNNGSGSANSVGVGGGGGGSGSGSGGGGGGVVGNGNGNGNGNGSGTGNGNDSTTGHGSDSGNGNGSGGNDNNVSGGDNKLNSANNGGNNSGNNGGSANSSNSDNNVNSGHSSDAHTINNDITQPTMHSSSTGSLVINNTMNNLRFPHGINSAANMFQHNLHPHGPPQHIQHNRTSPLMAPPNSDNHNHNHYGHPMPNILIQPLISGMSTNLLPPTQPQVHPMSATSIPMQNMMHNEMTHSPHLTGSYSISQLRNKQDMYNHEKSLSGDDHIPVHNEALMSPSNLNKNDPLNITSNDKLHRDNESKSIGISNTNTPNNVHHQAHVIESVTISPGTSHHFKMESM